MEVGENAALPSRDAAAYLGVAPKTLANWRADGKGPRYVRLGAVRSRVRYRLGDLDEWLAEHTSA